MACRRWISLLLMIGVSTICLQFSPLLEVVRAADVLSLDDAIAIAMKNNRTVQTATMEMEKNDAGIAALRTRRYPQLNLRYTGAQQLTPLDFTFQRGSLGTISTGEAIPTTDITISNPKEWGNQGQALVSQPISQLYRISLEIEQYGLVKNIAEEQHRNAKTSVINDVRKAYFGILETQSSFKAVTDAIGFYKELVRLMTDHLQKKTILKADLLEAKSKLARARYDATKAEHALSSQKEQLNHLMGRDLSTPFAVSEAMEQPPLEMDQEAAVETAMKLRPEIREAKLKARQAEYGMKIKRSEYIPDVDLVASYITFPEMQIVPRDYAYAGVRISWEPFDWGRKQQELSEKKKSMSQAASAVSEAESRVRLDVMQNYRKMREADQYLGVARLNQEAARERLQVIMDRYKQKSVLFKDLLQTQAQAAEANHQFHQALLGCLAAKSDFQKALGGEGI